MASDTRTQTLVTILGSGTCVPSLKRSSCAVLMETGASRIVMDIGAGTMHRLLAAGVEVFDVTHLLLSHIHPDHSGELVPFLFANKYPDGRRRRLPLRLLGGEGLNAFFSGLKAVYGHWIELPDALLSLHEMRTDGPDRYAAGDFTLTTRPMRHNPESVAYRIVDHEGRSMVYSGDTDVNGELVRLAAGAELLICESALPDAQRVPGHLTPSLCGEIAAAAGVGHLVLTHLYPACEQVDLMAQARRTWDGPLTIAEDLMRFSISDDAPTPLRQADHAP